MIEEAAWTDHAASTEEGVAARDDLRTSLGQAHVLRRNAHLASVVHRTLDAVLAVEAKITRRSGGLLHGALAAVARRGHRAGALGRPDHGSPRHALPGHHDVRRRRRHARARTCPTCRKVSARCCDCAAMLASPAEPTGGLPLPDGPLAVEFRGLEFSYGTGTFALRDVDLLSRPGTPAPSSAARGRASRRSRHCCRAPWSRPAARCCSAASTCSTSTCSSCAPRSASSPSAPRCWPAPWPTTSPSSTTSPARRSRRRSPSSA